MKLPDPGIAEAFEILSGVITENNLLKVILSNPVNRDPNTILNIIHKIFYKKQRELGS